jgi:N-hydroxyarylamine O-acetyltransferase
MNTWEYCSRIDFRQKLGANIGTLQALQLAHLKTVPFENLDISLGRRIKLDEDSLWNKIILNKRGGFCYELNGLFASLLSEIGFEVTHLNARDYQPEDNSFGIDFDHLALMVRVPHEPTRWLVEVGWGDTFTQPLDIDDPKDQRQRSRTYRIEPFQNGYQLWQIDHAGTIARHYFFDLTPRNFPSDYEMTCSYHQSSPKSIFTQKRIISCLTDEGRISLDNDKLIVTRNGVRSEREVSEQERPALLREYFGVQLNRGGR